MLEPDRRSDEASVDSFADFYRTSAFRRFPQEHRQGGTFELGMLDVRRGAIETVDPAMPEYAFVTSPTNADAFEFDFGDGWKTAAFKPGIVGVQPANAACGFRLPALHLRGVTVGERTLRTILGDLGLTPECLNGVTGVFRHSPRASEELTRMWHASSQRAPLPIS